MRYFRTWIIIVFTVMVSVHVLAQLAMRLELNKQNYIQYEKVYAKLIIRNQTAHPIVFGENEKLNGKIKFKVEAVNGKNPKIRTTPLYKVENRLLKAGEQESFFIPLSKYFQFDSEGTYKVKAIVSHVQIPDEYESNQEKFSIVHSNVIWSTKVGVPSLSGDNKNKKIESREYSIVSYHDGAHKLYYLIVQDRDYIYGLASLGFDIGTRVPECMVDRLSKLHILLQAGPNIYSYFVYDINCKLEDKMVYKQLEESTITLFRDENTGRINIVGGVKAASGSDYIEESGSKK